MKELHGISRFAIGASAAVHIGIAGVLCLHIEIPSIRSGPVSVLEVRLADSLEADPSSAGNRKASAPNPTRETTPPIRVKRMSPTPAGPDNGIETEIPLVEDETKSIPPSADTRVKTQGVNLGLSESTTSEEKTHENAEGTDRSNEMAQFLRNVRSRLESAKRYPWLAKMQGQEGTARVQFLIDPAGEVREIHLLESSQSKLLDDEAIETVKRVGRFPQLPLSWSKNVRIEVPMVFQLNSP